MNNDKSRFLNQKSSSDIQITKDYMGWDRKQTLFFGPLGGEKGAVIDILADPIQEVYETE